MKYKVTVEYISKRILTIEADSKEEAESLSGEVLDEVEIDFYANEVLKVESPKEDWLLSYNYMNIWNFIFKKKGAKLAP